MFLVIFMLYLSFEIQFNLLQIPVVSLALIKKKKLGVIKMCISSSLLWVEDNAVMSKTLVFYKVFKISDFLWKPLSFQRLVMLCARCLKSPVNLSRPGRCGCVFLPRLVEETFKICISLFEVTLLWTEILLEANWWISRSALGFFILNWCWQ